MRGATGRDDHQLASPLILLTMSSKHSGRGHVRVVLMICSFLSKVSPPAGHGIVGYGQRDQKMDSTLQEPEPV